MKLQGAFYVVEAVRVTENRIYKFVYRIIEPPRDKDGISRATWRRVGSGVADRGDRMSRNSAGMRYLSIWWCASTRCCSARLKL